MKEEETSIGKKEGGGKEGTWEINTSRQRKKPKDIREKHVSVDSADFSLSTCQTFSYRCISFFCCFIFTEPFANLAVKGPML